MENGNRYLLGYINGVNDYSWSCTFYGMSHLPCDVKLQYKDVKEFVKTKCDYYIVRAFGCIHGQRDSSN